MSKDPAFLFYPGDYLRDTQCLSESVQVAYDRIMCEHMRSICISKQQLNFFTKRLNEDQKQELMLMLSFIDGGYCIDWVYRSIMKRRAYSESRSNNGKKSHKSICKAYDKHSVIENEIVNRDENVVKTAMVTKEVFDFFCFTLKKKILLSSERQRIIEHRLREGRTIEELKKAITNFSKDDWPERGKFCDLVYAIGIRNKVDNLDKWLSDTEVNKKVPANHPKECPDCWGTGFETAIGSGQKITCRRKYENN